jgi:hypothetical protein
VLSNKFLSVRTLLNFCLEQIAHFGTFQLLALLMECWWRF